MPCSSWERVVKICARVATTILCHPKKNTSSCWQASVHIFVKAKNTNHRDLGSNLSSLQQRSQKAVSVLPWVHKSCVVRSDLQRRYFVQHDWHTQFVIQPPASCAVICGDVILCSMTDTHNLLSNQTTVKFAVMWRPSSPHYNDDGIETAEETSLFPHNILHFSQQII